MKLIEKISKTPVLVVAGTGGVGKTTMSVALALGLAQEKDAKVLVLTIDPAKRLADVLAKEKLGHQPSLIDHSGFVDQPVKGKLYGAMVDMTQGWHEIVQRHSRNAEDAQRIFSNKLFNNLTTRFSHSHDFAAMDQLYEHYRSGQYDYIVLDTPPTSKAFGFFDAPQAMSEFFGGKLVRLVTSPYRVGNAKAAKIFDIASQPFFSLADKILGKQFINDIGEFFFLFHTMYDEFHQRANDITKFLVSKKVHSSLIVNQEQFISRKDQKIIESLNARNIGVTVEIINNVLISSQDCENVKDYIQDNTQDSFVDFLKKNLTIASKLNDEVALRNTTNATTQSEQRAAILTIRRSMVQDEEARIKELVTNVQNTEIIDDTI